MDKRKHSCMGCAGYFEYPFHKNALLKTSTPLFLRIDIIGKGFHIALSLLVFERLFLVASTPQTLEQVREANEAFVQHYNSERPNQALSCGNRPPRVAFPVLPTLPPIPGMVDPDAWLWHLDGAHFIRKVRSNGSILIDDVPYYLKQTLSGQYVDVSVHAAKQELVVWHRHQPIKRLPIKGLQRTLLTFEQFVALMAQQALSEHRRLLYARRRTSRLAA